MKNKGFTLIELLVVISIIGLLASVVLVSLNSARLKARDTKRKADLKQIQTALAMYYDDYNKYPPPKPHSSCGGAPTEVWAESVGTCGGQWLTTDANFYKYMPNVPKDPTNQGLDAGGGDNNYVYSYYLAYVDQDYDLLTQLENSTDPMRCGITANYYHNLPNAPWCPPWAGNMGRSQNIYTDH